MKAFEKESYQVFDMFKNQWGLVTAGDQSHYNACTIGWGSLGTIWGHSGNGRPIATVYVNPDRYTWEFLKNSEVFTVCFFPEQYKKALSYLGTHSGRDGDKIKESGLTPVPAGAGIVYKEADLALICKKIYQAPFEWNGMSQEIKEFYKDWTPHWMFIGEIEEVKERKVTDAQPK